MAVFWKKGNSKVEYHCWAKMVNFQRLTVWFFVCYHLLHFIIDQSKFIYFLIELFFKLSYLAEDKNLCTKTNFFYIDNFNTYRLIPSNGWASDCSHIGLYFLCLFKAPCHWFISPNRGGTFLRENFQPSKSQKFIIDW